MIRRAACWLVAWPLAIPVSTWGWLHKRRILELGRPLTEHEAADASAIGIKQPQRIRVLSIPRVPNPFDRVSGIVEKLTGYSIFNPAGMTLHHGIFTVTALGTDRALLAHEFVHVVQYEHRGMFGFMRRYIFECLADGYNNAPMEVEARKLSNRLLSEN